MDEIRTNEYIKKYLESDKTRSAIMLNAPWGAGKSYYINKTLIPYLKQECQYECVVVSLFGVTTTYEISKSIYIEMKMRRFNHAGVKSSAKGERGCKAIRNIKRISSEGVVLSKSVLKGITSHYNVDLSLNQKDLEKLVNNSLNFKKTLIILEDVERCGIERQVLWGYINNLVEQDGTKVLLVANEEKYIEYTTKTIKNRSTGRDEEIREYTPETLNYLRLKEKTVVDTINFECDYQKAIRDIMSGFGDALAPFLNTEELAFIVFVVGLKNLRTFIYACQKTKDIFEKVGDISLEKKKCIFYSMIVFSKAVKSGTIPKWEGSEYLSVSLGVDRNFPLYRFCYDYIVWHEFNNEDVQKAFNAHELLRLYDERGSRNDDDMRRISDFSNYSEKEIRECLKRIESRLDDPEEIPYYAYGELAYCLTLFNLILDFDYTACREKMINNIQGQNIDLALLFLSCTEFESDAHKDLFEKFKMDIILSVQKVKGIDIDWNYDPDKIEELEQYVDEHEERILTMHRFISSINVDKMVDFVFRCCPEQLGTFRRILRRIYKNADWLTFDADEGAAMKIFTEKIEKRKEEKKGDPTFDKIVLLKINWLIGDLKEYERNLCR